jgi:TonB-linked SusC/RagA family outer membrane protein
MNFFSPMKRQEKTREFRVPPAFKTLCMIKLSTLSLLSLALGAHASGTAQTVNLSLKKVKVEKVLQEISKQTDLRFFYDEKLLDNLQPISVDANHASISQVLSKALKGQNLIFQILNNTIVISEKQRTDIEITGTVRDAQSALAGVTVSVEGNSALSTKTDANGHFSLRIPEKAVLTFQYMGYTTERIQVGNQRTLNVTLQTSTSQLDEVVVVGYGTQRKINLTGAVDQISAKEIENRPVTNLGAALQGLIPNLNITNASGNPSQSAKFNIRGITSINGGEPLILVDNIPVTGDELARLNPNDFENVSVLKDAASAAIYGARGAFGVVLVTTKSAKSEKLQVNVGMSTQWRTTGKLPEIVTDPLTVMQYKHDAAYPLYDLYPDAVREYAKKLQQDPSLPNTILDPTNPEKWAYYGQTDWMKEAYKKMAPTNTLNLSLGKRTDKLSYLFSGEYYKLDGALKYGNDKLNRYNIRNKMDMQVTPWLNFGNNTILTSRQYEAPVFMSGDFFWNVNRTSSLDVPKNPDGSWTQAGAGLLGLLQEGGRRKENINEFQTTFNAKADLIKNIWTANADVTFRRSFGVIDGYNRPVQYKTGPNATPQYAGGTVPSAYKREENTRYDVINVYTQYTQQFNDHHVSALVGYNQEYRNTEINYALKNGLYSADIPSIGLGSGATTVTHSIDDYALQGVFYRLNYDYKGRYLIESNGRLDGSSRFPKGDRWGFFPSVSAGWVLSEEQFFSPLKSAINFLKLRGSYGQLGNQTVYDQAMNPLSYPYLPSMAVDNGIPRVIEGNRPISLNPPLVVAKSLTWERISTINGGIDLNVLNNRLNTTFDIYKRTNEGMLIPGRTLPGAFGADAPNFNAADMKTNGWDLRISWKDKFDLAGSPFHYNATFTLANSKATITKFDNPTGDIRQHYAGQRIGEIWGLQADGFFQNEDELAKLNQTDVGTDDQQYKFYVGDIKFKDIAGGPDGGPDGKITKGKQTLADHGDLKILGNSEVQYPYSFDLSGSWKGFDLRVFLQGVGKRDWYPPGSQIYFWGIYAQPWTNVTKQNLDHWTPDNRDGYFPRIKSYSAEDTGEELGMPNTRYLQNAAYLRVKNITFGYSLSQNFTKRIGLQAVRFYVSGENLFERSGLKVSIDPEALGSTRVYPFQRTYAFGLNVKF